MKLAAVVLLLVVVYAVALELVLPAWRRLLSVPNLNKPAPMMAPKITSGQGTMTYADGSKRTGEWKDGKPAP